MAKEENKNSSKTTIILAVITLLGTIATSIIANWNKIFSNNEVPKTEIVQHAAGLNPGSPTEVKTVASGPKSYTGTVGKLSAKYTLHWKEDKTIEGSYYYPHKPAKNYILKGRDMGNGNIFLSEYTDNKVSATCELALKGACYSGKMNNTDGRQMDMTLCAEN